MGKFKTPRQKLNAKRNNAISADSKIETMSVCLSTAPRQYSASVSGRSMISSKSKSIFDKLDIDEHMLTNDIEAAVKSQLAFTNKQSLEDLDFDTRSFVTSKSLKGLKLKKKDIQKLKHEVWRKKVGVIESHLKEIKDAEKRQQTPVTGDMKPLIDALPVVDWINNSKIAKRKQETKPRSVPKQKKLQKQMLEGVDFFQTVLNHPTFKADPFNTITEHLKTKMDTNQ